MRAYVFVDAENHFLRSVAAAEDLIGNAGAAEALSKTKFAFMGRDGFPHNIDGRRFGYSEDLQLFWDCHLLSINGLLSALRAKVQRAIHACSCTGDEDKAHEIRVKIREYEFEPIVVRESKSQKKRRSNSLKQHQLIEKPKGCDIALATRMVADAAANLFDCCFLFTSDADFIPAVEAVRRMGKIVWVFGYQNALPQRSPYLYVPDRFIDVEVHLRQAWFNEVKIIDNS